MKLKRSVLVLGFLMATAATTWSDSGTMSVQVKEGQLRSAPSFLGTIVGPVAYGEQVETVQQQGDWMNVKSSRNVTGWIHQSALTKKQVVLGSGGRAQSAATGQEVALAGKGFNADVEAKYKATHGKLDFASVDRMESIKVSREEMIKFLNDGSVKSPEGGAK